jgi:hypothetical protein
VEHLKPVRLCAAPTIPRTPFAHAPGVLSDGSFVLASGWNVGVLAGGVAGVRRDTVTIARYRPDGRFQGMVARLPGREEYLKAGGAGFSTSPVPFARETYLAVSGEAIWLGDSDRFRVERRSREGRVGVVADEIRGAPIEVADVERYKRERLARITVDSYGTRGLNPQEVADIMKEVYDTYPLP